MSKNVAILFTCSYILTPIRPNLTPVLRIKSEIRLQTSDDPSGRYWLLLRGAISRTNRLINQSTPFIYDILEINFHFKDTKRSEKN